MTKTIRVDIVSDVVCPWCVIGYSQLARASVETGLEIEVHWHPFELNPQMPPEGENLQEHLAAKYGTTPEDSRRARERLTEMGAALGFTFDYADDMRMVNTFRAHQLIDWAAERGRGHEANMALFAAFFTRRENLDDPHVLAEVASGIGLDRDAALAMLEAGSHAQMVREKEQFWTSRGISGVPAMIFDRQHLVTGAQGEENYARILRHLAEEQAA
ncbi:DsbA family oxidoreductase [Limimaricola pyoseonensis]|uniref:Predicted dithiol-disulfide isomerase, DsbA family n=1 Tax=Limimaricola pyoseonensis TaxID=521013 RepID=A0A1G7A197_9RHOB|nr:DsbA family oxidoreductase [Limimaricola pyoseonensis]SDE08287.1 Predicted dithiol-disulfide isomerase, DsbA family [Limimaricola pyoseonensis]